MLYLTERAVNLPHGGQVTLIWLFLPETDVEPCCSKLAGQAYVCTAPFASSRTQIFAFSHCR